MAEAARFGFGGKYLDLDDTTEFKVIEEVIMEMQEQEQSRQKAFLRNIEAAVQSGMVKALGG